MVNTVWTRAKRYMKGKMMRHMRGMITCVEFEEFILSYLDGTLPKDEVRKFEWHIRFCRECREYLAAYKQTIELARAVHRDISPPPSSEIPEDLVSAILKARNK